jgi:hypothetical protein
MPIDPDVQTALDALDARLDALETSDPSASLGSRQLLAETLDIRTHLAEMIHGSAARLLRRTDVA